MNWMIHQLFRSETITEEQFNKSTPAPCGEWGIPELYDVQKHVFRQCDDATLRNCRQVCRLWQQAAMWELEQRQDSMWLRKQIAVWSSSVEKGTRQLESTSWPEDKLHLKLAMAAIGGTAILRVALVAYRRFNEISGEWASSAGFVAVEVGLLATSLAVDIGRDALRNAHDKQAKFQVKALQLRAYQSLLRFFADQLEKSPLIERYRIITEIAPKLDKWEHSLRPDRRAIQKGKIPGFTQLPVSHNCIFYIPPSLFDLFSIREEDIEAGGPGYEGIIDLWEYSPAAKIEIDRISKALTEFDQFCNKPPLRNQ